MNEGSLVMELWQLWLLFVVPGIAGFIIVIGGLFIICVIVVGAISFCYYVLEERGDIKKWFACMKKIVPAVVIVCVVTFVSALIPSKKDAMLIVGGYYATNIEDIAKLPPNVIKATNKFIEEYLNAE